jgi:hypothetical protein
MGEAAGTAAHLSLARNTRCPDIAVDVLQNLLQQGGAFLGADPQAI